ncbi:hypothetical protein IB277_31740 [Ensifer sp. ENS07]|jgi:type IV secretory pathway VirB3-like protein|uniref:Transmembrane protein n=1 Tax=Ensifer adhaerens TaxID=106592 RepID=A0A9Q8Y5N2_ENSAD|nr:MULTISPECIES: hypothetical protein [Ensifer]MBD9593433.1 hypothetical protein [Ensifer sp. ENS05]MBD9640874.1 hypothetical protein [Ensifer sp. ENS07]USJ22873.1 hypothetical protein NE863_16490 [Ensifer adhaerens]UTV36196.1 hypothetical protein MYG64_16875 [Ensifer adhaerens]SDL90818.1 hypothetical protein SAMN05216328_104249 [Ensifer sp. YR511]
MTFSIWHTVIALLIIGVPVWLILRATTTAEPACLQAGVSFDDHRARRSSLLKQRFG